MMEPIVSNAPSSVLWDSANGDAVFDRVLDEVTSYQGVIHSVRVPLGKEHPVPKCLQDASFLKPGSELLGQVNEHFSHPLLQILMVALWNRERKWGFTWEQFERVFDTIPAWPERPFVAVVLVPYLPWKKGVEGYIRTFHELWECAKCQQEASRGWRGYSIASLDSLRLLGGIESKIGLHWELIDLGSNRNKQPRNVRSVGCSPDAGLLAAASLHPSWVKGMDGDLVPYILISGYEALVRGPMPRWSVPDLYFDRDEREIQLSYSVSHYSGSCWAVPSFFRE